MTDEIKTRALELGLDLCGIARARILLEREIPLREWAGSPRRGGLSYMERNLDKRLDPSLLVEGAASVIICGASYNRGNGCGEGGWQEIQGIPSRIASYALTTDYHITMRERLTELLKFITEIYPGASGRVFVDTAPLLEKNWAVEAGLGWIGRNSLLINPRLGSFMVLGAVITDAILHPDKPFGEDGCTECRACIAVCPAGAIGPDRMIDASRCISALTIEKGGDASLTRLHGRIFGCDACQSACPYNKAAPVSVNPMFRLREEFLIPRGKWLEMTETEFHTLFRDTPLERVPLAELQKRIGTFTEE